MKLCVSLTIRRYKFFHPPSSIISMAVYPLKLSLRHPPRDYYRWNIPSGFSTLSVDMLYPSCSLSQLSSKTFWMRNHVAQNFVRICTIPDLEKHHVFWHNVKWSLHTFVMSFSWKSYLLFLHTFLSYYFTLVAYVSSDMALYMHQSNSIFITIRKET